MSTQPNPRPETKRPVTVFLSQADYDRLRQICEDRSQSRADFLRDAIDAHEAIAAVHKAPLRGACLRLHQARLERERSAGRRTRKKKV